MMDFGDILDTQAGRGEKKKEMPEPTAVQV